MRPGLLRWTTLGVWALLLLAFWLAVRAAQEGPVGLLLGSVSELAHSAWAPLILFGLYLLRPLLLVPITALNLASGLVLGAALGLTVALAGTLLSASAGYILGRLLGAVESVERLSRRWRFVRLLRERSFEAVVAGGLMYLHADLVNFPAGALRVRYPLFLLGIAIGNCLTMTVAVLTGSALEGSIGEARLTVDYRYLAAAALLFLVSLAFASFLRRRLSGLPGGRRTDSR